MLHVWRVLVCVVRCGCTADTEQACAVFTLLRSCQRYEGGFAGEPGGEAHGGYAFCAFAKTFDVY